MWGSGIFFGIGPARARNILRKTGVAGETRVKDLREEDIVKLRETIDREYDVEGDLRKELTMGVKRLNGISEPIEDFDTEKVFRLEDNVVRPMREHGKGNGHRSAGPKVNNI